MSEISRHEGAGPREQLPIMGVRQGMFGVHGSGDTTGFGGLTRHVRVEGITEQPFGSWFDEVYEVLREVLTEQGLDPVAELQRGAGHMVALHAKDVRRAISELRTRDDLMRIIDEFF